MTVSIHHASCLDWLAEYDGPLFDSCVTDPPYHLTSIVKRFGGKNAAEAKVGATGAYARAAKGFMGKEWDGGDIAFRPETWRAVFDVLKPGAHLVAFAATRGGHRMACAIEDAGFEIRDCLGWAFGAGFPKSHNVSKTLGDSLPADALCACAPDCQQIVPNSQSDCQTYRGCDDAQPRADLDGDQDVLPSQADVRKHNPSRQHEDDRAAATSHSRSSSSARPSSDDCLDHSLHHSEDCRVSDSELSDRPLNRSNAGSTAAHKTEPDIQDTPHLGGGLAFSSSDNSGCDNSNIPHCRSCGKVIVPEGLGTALKPAWEMIYLARKPLSEKSVAANVLKHGTGALNIDACRVGTEGGTAKKEKTSGAASLNAFGSGLNGGGPSPIDKGRWPANLCHDGSDEVLAGFPETTTNPGTLRSNVAKGTIGLCVERPEGTVLSGGDSGSAARFFYSAKAGPLDRIGTAHATVKPVDLMRWLVRMVTPPGGHILEPFAGSGTTGIAAMAEGFDCTMIELEADHVADIERKLAFLRGEGALTFQEHNHAKLQRAKETPLGGLFGGAA